MTERANQETRCPKAVGPLAGPLDLQCGLGSTACLQLPQASRWNVGAVLELAPACLPGPALHPEVSVKDPELS